ncbi:MAG: hypothetical protein IH899_10390 [Planctomycetes bacterium]|nr:hypothetical protein [Planctomycetota bacterium]
MPGALTNAVDGILNSQAGAGTRRLGASLTNLGTVNINKNTTFDKSNGQYTNQGTINVNGGNLTLTQSGSATFTNAATGTLAIAGARTLEVGSVAVISEGGQNIQTGHPFSFSREAATAANNTEESFIALRLATLLNGITFRGRVDITKFEMVVSGFNCHWRWRYIPTLTNADFQAPVTHSAVETDIASTAVADGVVIDEGFIAAGQGNRSTLSIGELLQRLPFALDPDGTQTILLALTIEGVGGTTTVSGSITREEVR